MKEILKNSFVIVVLIIFLCLPITSGILNLKASVYILENDNPFSFENLKNKKMKNLAD